MGSASYLTNLDGEIAQHIEYVPFGEVFLEERNNKWNSPYLFNGKELDEETGLSYYGARYYNPRVSNWLSVDPLALKYPSRSPYEYTFSNPVKFIDPDGREGILFVDVAGVGHGFVGVMDEKGVFTIYTYGQYGQGKNSGDSKPAGQGALIRLKGEDAYNYLNEHYHDDGYDIRAFYLSDEKLDEKGVRDYFDKIIDNPEAIPAENKNDVCFVKGKGSKAVKYKYYTGVPAPACTENCVSVADEGLEAGGSDIIGTEWWPFRLNAKLKVFDRFDKNLKEVTREVKADVKSGNTNLNVDSYGIK